MTHPDRPDLTPKPTQPDSLPRAVRILIPTFFILILLAGGGWSAYQHWWLPHLKREEQRLQAVKRLEELRKQRVAQLRAEAEQRKQALAILEQVQAEQGRITERRDQALAIIRQLQAEPEGRIRKVPPSKAMKNVGDAHDLPWAVSLERQAIARLVERRFEEAGALYQKVLEIRGKNLGPDHPDSARVRSNLALIYHVQGRYAEAEALLRRSLDLHGK